MALLALLAALSSTAAPRRGPVLARTGAPLPRQTASVPVSMIAVRRQALGQSRSGSPVQMISQGQAAVVDHVDEVIAVVDHVDVAMDVTQRMSKANTESGATIEQLKAAAAKYATDTAKYAADAAKYAADKGIEVADKGFEVAVVNKDAAIITAVGVVVCALLGAVAMMHVRTAPTTTTTCTEAPDQVQGPYEMFESE